VGVEAVRAEELVVLRPPVAGVGGGVDADEPGAAVEEVDEVGPLLRGERRAVAAQSGRVHEDDAVDALIGLGVERSRVVGDLDGERARLGGEALDLGDAFLDAVVTEPVGGREHEVVRLPIRWVGERRDRGGDPTGEHEDDQGTQDRAG
jgi:hypothetical protein